MVLQVRRVQLAVVPDEHQVAVVAVAAVRVVLDGVRIVDGEGRVRHVEVGSV